MMTNVQNVNTAIFHEQSDYYCMQQMHTQNIIFVEKKLVVSNILSFASRKMIGLLSFEKERTVRSTITMNFEAS